MSKRLTMVKLAKDYLAYRRQLGYELRHVGRLLQQFARYADRNGHRGPLTVQLAIRWAKLPRKAPRSYWARRLGLVRGFAKYCAILDPDTEIPSPDAFGQGYCRITPYIYSAAEIAALVAAARKLPPRKSLRPHTYATLFGLLACTGLRLREALNLTRLDVDWKQGLLTIRQTKFRKFRLVPLHPTAVSAMRSYAQVRDRLNPAPRTNAFFVTVRGTRLSDATVRGAFAQLRKQLSWTGHGGRPWPRIHDLRHTFASCKLLQWYKQGKDLDQVIAALSTYLGHVNVNNTYWYLTGVPKLLQLAGTRFEHFKDSIQGGHK
jgi:integrase